mmetsp:Transcript_476/g.764  ORF Transcript_476/g.764 Transcript_476/m.764 type:complete len:684 (-) Transcript_476:96-2147(-)
MDPDRGRSKSSALTESKELEPTDCCTQKLRDDGDYYENNTNEILTTPLVPKNNLALALPLGNANASVDTMVGMETDDEVGSSSSKKAVSDYSKYFRKRSVNDNEEPRKQTLLSMECAKLENYSSKEKRRERLRTCCHHFQQMQKSALRNTITVMNILARVLFWISVVAMAIGVIWYSRELYFHGTDPHLIAWFSAGGFVILGFPISMYGILMHLSNYYQPNIQCYVIRILWMVPIYSIESWLCLRFHVYAIYIETLRDLYESFVLYCFLQFLIQVLGGEETLITILKDKSPTRGVHYSPLNWCMKPWVMGQPISNHSSIGITGHTKSTRWTSPFFVRCKFGVLQYVLLKFVLSIFVVLLESYGLYKEGDFTPYGGYLYICILTNLSQCWALYCLVFFYYATKNELSPIRPVGKFLSVKALVFFTWWQSVGISILFQVGLIKQYKDGEEWTAEDVAKGLQDYLICVEMFIGAVVHTFVFPHTDYLKPVATELSGANARYVHNKRLGRRARRYHSYSGKDDRSNCSKTSSNVENDTEKYETMNDNTLLGAFHDRTYRNFHEVEPILNKNKPFKPLSTNMTSLLESTTESLEVGKQEVATNSSSNSTTTSPQGHVEHQRTGFVRALIDSTVPRDVMNNTVGIAMGEFHVEKKTLLSHALASDEYDLFAKRRKQLRQVSSHLKEQRN